MQNSDESAQGWEKMMTMLIQAARSARECLLSALFVVLALSTTGIPRSPAVQAQDTGTGLREQATVSYQLVAAPQNIGTICVGETKTINIAIVASLQMPGDSDTGRVTAHGLQLYAFSEDPRILGVNAETASVGGPGSVGYVLSGTAAGSTSITVEAEGGGNSALPDPAGVHFSLPVQVIPCEYRVSATSSWFGFIVSGNIWITARPDDVTLTREEGDTTFMARERLTYVHWDATSNRFKGCLPDHATLEIPLAVTFHGEIVDDQFSLTMKIEALDYGIGLFPCHKPIAHVRVAHADCNTMLDGMCNALVPDPSLLIAPEEITVQFPLEGGTERVRQGLRLSQGQADGDAVITLTPVEP